MGLDKFLKSIAVRIKDPDPRLTALKLRSITFDQELKLWVITNLDRDYDDGIVGCTREKRYFMRKDLFTPVIEDLRQKGNADINQPAVYREDRVCFDHSASPEDDESYKISVGILGGCLRLKDSKLDLSALKYKEKEIICEEFMYNQLMEWRYKEITKKELARVSPQTQAQ